MLKTAAITTRVTPETKENAERIVNQFGLNLSDAISMFLAQIVNRNAIPIDLTVPICEFPQYVYDELDELMQEPTDDYVSAEDAMKMWRATIENA